MTAKALRYWTMFLESKGTNETNQIIDLKQIQRDPEFYLALNEFVQYLKFKNLHPRTVRSYFSCIKGYLRSRGFRIYNEDVKQFIKLPKILKEQKEAISKDTIQLLLDNASPKMKLAIMCLVTSGMRANEFLQLRASDLQEPKVILRPEITKTGVGRTTYFSPQTWGLVAAKLLERDNQDYVFCYNYRPLKSLIELESKFGKLRDKCGISKRYNISKVHTLTLHRLRAYLKTEASEACGKDYAEGLIGHEGYLSTYYNLTDEARFKNYINKLAPLLTFRLK